MLLSFRVSRLAGGRLGALRRPRRLIRSNTLSLRSQPLEMLLSFTFQGLLAAGSARSVGLAG